MHGEEEEERATRGAGEAWSLSVLVEVEEREEGGEEEEEEEEENDDASTTRRRKKKKREELLLLSLSLARAFSFFLRAYERTRPPCASAEEERPMGRSSRLLLAASAAAALAMLAFVPTVAFAGPSPAENAVFTNYIIPNDVDGKPVSLRSAGGLLLWRSSRLGQRELQQPIQEKRPARLIFSSMVSFNQIYRRTAQPLTSSNSSFSPVDSLGTIRMHVHERKIEEEEVALVVETHDEETRFLARGARARLQICLL